MPTAGFDIGGTHARLRVFDDAFTDVLYQERRRIRGETSPAQILRTIVEMLADAPAVGAVGIGFAGLLSVDGRTVHNSPNLHWRDIDFGGMLDLALPSHRFAIANDLNAMLWGEHLRGACQDTDNALAVYVGTGIGGALMCDGQLLLGSGGKAGEIGHTKVVVGGRPCGCGGHGCVEAYAGGEQLERMTADVRPDLMSGDGIVDLQRADAEARDDERLHEIWERATDHLSLIIANACTLLNPGVLLLGGGIIENLDTYRAALMRKVAPLIVGPALDDLEIRFGELEEAAVLGAAMLAHDSETKHARAVPMP